VYFVSGLPVKENFNYKKQIEDEFGTLVRTIDLTDEAIDRFSFIDELKHTLIELRSRSTPTAKVTYLLRVLVEQPVHIHRVCKILTEIDQEHAACLLTGKSKPGWEPMSEAHHRLLKERSNRICQFLNPLSGILEELSSTNTFQERDVERVNSKHGIMDKMALELITILKRKPDRAFDEFKTALVKTEQKHVVFIMTGEGEPPLTEYHVQLLRRLRADLIVNILVDGCQLLDCLIAVRALTNFDGQWILDATTSDGKATRLVDVMLRKPQSAFDKFVNSLATSDQLHVVELLKCHQVKGIVQSDYLTEPTAEERESVESNLTDAMNVSDDAQQFMKNDLLYKFEHGSIHIHFKCLSRESVDVLRELHESGKLNNFLNTRFRHLLDGFGIRSLSVIIDASEFDRCRSAFNVSNMMTAMHRQALRMAAERWNDKIRVGSELLKHLRMDELREQEIVRTEPEELRARVLLDIVSRMPDRSFDELIAALRRTRQDSAADAIVNYSKPTRNAEFDGETLL